MKKTEIGTQALMVLAPLVLITGISLAAIRVQSGLQSFDGSVAVHELADVSLINDRGDRVVIGPSTHGVVIVLGYSRCTDECPVTVSRVASALSRVGRARRPGAFFVTVDPSNDTPAVLHRYLSPWHGIFVGVTGEKEALQRFYAAIGSLDPQSHYREHDTRIFIADPDGYVDQELSPESSPAAIQRAALGA